MSLGTTGEAKGASAAASRLSFAWHGYFESMNSGPPSRTSGLAELMVYCEALTWPATEHDRRTFEALFRCVAPELSLPERGEAERLARHKFPGLDEGSVSKDLS